MPAVTVSVQNNIFTPEIASVNVGGTVTWNWTASDHTVTSVLSPAFNANTGVQNAGFTLGPLTFNTLGTFAYICTVHGSVSGNSTSGMAGTVVVQ
jgi:plastocyanin